MTAQQTPRGAISPALKQRASETRSAFANQDAAASKQAHDETIRDWEEDGHGEGDAAVEVYRRVDALQAGLCLAILLESAFGSSLERKKLVAIGLSLATAHALREWTTQTWYARHYYRERQREEWELENYAQGERAEMVGLWYDLGVPRCGGAFTPSTRHVSVREGAGWSFFRFLGCFRGHAMTSQVLQRADEARRGAVHRPAGVVQKVLRRPHDDRGAAHVRAAVGRGVSANYRGVAGRDGVRPTLAIGRCP